MPCLVVLIGPALAGKTTWAHEHFAPNEVVSSDSLRAMVGIDEADQAAGPAAFEILERIVTERVNRRLTTVIDTTGLSKEDRTRWVGLAHAGELPAYAILFATTEQICLERNRTRPRSIPQNVLRKQFRRFTAAVDDVGEEGFDGVYTEQPVVPVAPSFAELVRDTRDPRRGHTFGLILSRFDWPDGNLSEHLTSVARRAEEAGFRDLWVMDHFRQIPSVGRAWEEMPEALVTLSYLASVTERIRLGVMVAAITHRHPVVMGKMLATLDVLSGGRAICGLGAAWDEAEHAAYGIPFPSLSTRYDMLEDTLRMLPLLWGKGSPEFQGETFSASELICYPRPVQDPIPMLVGGGGERRTLRLAAQYADMANVFGKPDQVRHKAEVINRHCQDLERDPADVEMSHLVTGLVAEDSKALRKRIDQMRERNTSPEDYASRYNAALPDDFSSLVAAYDEAGASHTVVRLTDVALEGSVEAFGAVIANFDRS